MKTMIAVTLSVVLVGTTAWAADDSKVKAATCSDAKAAGLASLSERVAGLPSEW